jgi:hypothetical protein|tara:strand:+ start:51 stop:191 length:141 start_codon:yes stop_codon:yes gene_type:complete
MIRYSQSLKEEEVEMLEEMRAWLQERLGVRVSRNELVRMLLFRLRD